MQNSPSLFLVMAVTIGLIGFLTTSAGVLASPRPVSRRGSIGASLPAVVLLVLFYSLAFHMYRTLGGWPNVIGTDGFPAPLSLHASITGFLFSMLLLGGASLWPMLCLGSAFNGRWRHLLPYFGIFGVACCVCFLAMTLAPAGFLDWWWD